VADKVTIRDVARQAGVSISTVSHALSGKRPISAETRERIHRVIDRLGYEANSAARVLSGGKTMQVGLLLDGVRNNATGELIEYIENRLRHYGYRTLLSLTHDDPATAAAFIRRFSASTSVDGILNLCRRVSVVQAASLAAPIPVVTFLRTHHDSPACLDFVSGVLAAMEHLWALGHRRIGFISHPNVNEDNPEDSRTVGYERFLAGLGAEVDPDLVAIGDGSMESGFSHAARLIARGATALFCANDMTAIGVLRWAHETGMDVPKDLSVVGFDDIPMAALTFPPLTTVRVPTRELAERTVDALVLRMQGKPVPDQVILSPSLVVRRSTSRRTQS
jgi:DNA-binding LacI/PurR family transcriptional regulator